MRFARRGKMRTLGASSKGGVTLEGET